MLQFLQTGKALYVLAAITVLGILSKLVTSSIYKRLIKETGNMALTKNKNLKALKMKTENMILITQGIRNAGAYIDKQIYGFRFMGISLDDWDNLSMQAMILNFLVGGAAAFGSYWYRCDSYYIVLYGTMGILGGLFLVLVENSANIALKRQQLIDCLVDYVENSPHFYKSTDRVQESMNTAKKNKAAVAAARPRLREVGKKDVIAAEEMAVGEETDLAAGKEEAEERAGRFHIEKLSSKSESGKTGSAQGERQGGRFSVLSKKKEADKDERMPRAVSSVREESRQEDVDDDELAKSIEYLRESLDQIAASREQGRKSSSGSARQKEKLEAAKKELKPEDLRILGEILQEYLS